MKLKKIPYTNYLFTQVRDFLVDTYDPTAAHHNWQIDRWNFSRFVSQTIHETVESWPDTVGVWVDKSAGIQAVVNSEGENRGDAFFQLVARSYTDEELEKLVDHAEEYLFVTKKDSRKKLQPRVGTDFNQLIKILQNRGYQRTGEKEPAGLLEITGPEDGNLPKRLRLVDVANFSDQKRGVAHSLAFGYAREGALEEYHIVEAFKNMRRAPDYREELDLAVLDQKGDVAAFATFWLDRVNKFGMLEPLGTVPAYQRMGLARALIYEGINRLHELGADILYGPVNQEFYLRIGFKPAYEFEVWEKEWGGSDYEQEMKVE